LAGYKVIFSNLYYYLYC